MGPLGIETGSLYYKDIASTETQAVYREDCVAFSIESRDQLQCDMCRKSFSDAALLAVHQWIHSSDSSKAGYTKDTFDSNKDSLDLEERSERQNCKVKQIKVSKPENTRFPCDVYDYTATQAGNRKRPFSDRAGAAPRSGPQMSHVSPSTVEARASNVGALKPIVQRMEVTVSITSGEIIRKKTLASEDCSEPDMADAEGPEPQDANIDIQKDSQMQRVEIVYDPDPNLDIQEFKLVPEPQNIQIESDCESKKQKLSKPGERRFSCAQCEYVTIIKDCLLRHKKSHHMLRFPCDKCDYKAFSKSGLKLHKESIHEGVRYRCDQCEHIAKNDQSLRYHKRSKHSVIKHLCDQCDYEAPTVGALKQHKAKHDSFRYHCDQCDFGAVQMGHLKQHKASTHQGIRYPCDHCDYAAKSKESLKKHIIAIHEGIKLECDQCDFSTSHTRSLKRHKASKHEGMKYPCDQCAHSSTGAWELKLHIASKHEGKIHLCDKCDYVAYRADVLKQHKASKHDGVKYPCDQCDYKATDKSNLTKHKVSKHKG